MGLSLETLDAVVWDGLVTGHPSRSAETVPRALRRLALAGADARERDVEELFCLTSGSSTATPVAVPFLLALATDPAMGARPALAELLAHLLCAPQLLARHRAAVLSLLADPDPQVRRKAAPLAATAGVLTERWRVEEDRTVRAALLLDLDGSEGAEGPEVLAEALAGDDPALYVVAVWVCAAADRDLPVRHFEQLLALFGDLSLRPRFGGAWFAPYLEEPFEREHLLGQVLWLFAHRPDLELAAVLRLSATAERTGDTLLCLECLDFAWSLLLDRSSVGPELLPVAGRLLDHPAPAVRHRAANLLAALGPAAAPYADRLAALLDDGSGDDNLDGTVGALARWALLRIGDPRGLPGLVEQLRAQEEDSRGYNSDEPHRPGIPHVLAPLRAHADVLLPGIRAALRLGGPRGGATRGFLAALKTWGPDAAPALPELLPLLDSDWTAHETVAVLRAIGPAAAPALRASAVAHWAPWDDALLAGDEATALRLIGEAALAAGPPWHGPVEQLARFGPAAAPYADLVRHVMATTSHWTRLTAASTLWEITGRPSPAVEVLAGFVLDTTDGFRLFAEALRTMVRQGAITPEIRTSLLTLRHSDRRLSAVRSYQAILDDEQHRALIDRALACPDAAS